MIWQKLINLSAQKRKVTSGRHRSVGAAADVDVYGRPRVDGNFYESITDEHDALLIGS